MESNRATLSPAQPTSTCPQTALALALHRVYNAKLHDKNRIIQDLTRKLEGTLILNGSDKENQSTRSDGQIDISPIDSRLVSLTSICYQLRSVITMWKTTLPDMIRHKSSRQDLLIKENVDRIVERVHNQEVLLHTERTKRRDAELQLIELKGNIRVFVRIRPTALSSSSIKRCDRHTVELPGAGPFEFDHIFDGGSTQTEIWSEVSPAVSSVLAGYSACIFAYGQTGAGKTYTMEGPPGNPGINQRALQCVFDDIKLSGLQYIVRLSVLEVYNETCRDLLRPTTSDVLKVRSSDVAGLTLQVVTSAEQVVDLSRSANVRRSSEKTDCNESSSRSHCIVMLDIQGETFHSKLALIDLAGSERVGKSGVVGARLKETCSINQSLSTLGNVMSALGKKATFIPYRDSLLTLILKDCLCGSGRTIMMCHISPDEHDLAETLCTLKFAERSRKVELGATVRRNSGKELNRLRVSRDELRIQLEQSKETNADLASTIANAQEKYAGLEASMRVQHESLSVARSEIVQLRCEVVDLRAKLGDRRTNRSAEVPANLDSPRTPPQPCRTSPPIIPQTARRLVTKANAVGTAARVIRNRKDNNNNKSGWRKY